MATRESGTSGEGESALVFVLRPEVVRGLEDLVSVGELASFSDTSYLGEDHGDAPAAEARPKENVRVYPLRLPWRQGNSPGEKRCGLDPERQATLARSAKASGLVLRLVVSERKPR